MIALVILLLLVLLAVWVSLPLLPAVLIYRLFPNTSVTTSGPLANLTINASGAFAAYLIVFLITMPMANSIKNAIGGAIRPSWEIHGQVKLVDEGKTILREDLLTTIRLETRPSVLSHTGEALLLKIPEEDGYFPRVVVQVPDWGYGFIDLNRDNFQKSRFSRVIDVGEVEIKKVPLAGNYNGTSPMGSIR